MDRLGQASPNKASTACSDNTQNTKEVKMSKKIICQSEIRLFDGSRDAERVLVYNNSYGL